HAALRLEFVMLDLRETHKDLRTTKQTLARLEYEALQSKQGDRGPPKLPEILVENQLNADPKIRELRSRIAETTALLDQAKKRAANPNDPTILRLQTQLEMQNKELESLQEQLRPTVEKSIRQTLALQNVHVDPEVRQREIARLQERQKHLEEDI